MRMRRIVGPRDHHFIAYSQAKLIDNLEKPLDWLTVAVNASEGNSARDVPPAVLRLY